MMNDIDIKNKRILLFDFDGTLIETASGNTFATDLTDMRIKMDVVNKALDLMQENGVKVFAIVSNQGGVEAGFVSGADIEAKIEYVLRSVHDLAVKFDSLTRDWLDGRKIKALMPFCIMPGGKVRFSLYECVEDSADCCEVSKRFGGGGHAGAAGFVLDVTDIRFREFIEKHKLISQ